MVTKPILTLVPKTGNWQLRDGKSGHSVITRVRDRAKPESNQLSLPFEEAEVAQLRIVIAPMDDIHGSALNTAIVEYRPRAVLDLRHALRFDLYGTDRRTIFAYFNAFHTYYSVSSVPWHALSAKDFMSEASRVIPRVRHELIERDQSPLMLFVPKTEHANMLRIYLNRLLSARAKISWALEQIS